MGLSWIERQGLKLAWGRLEARMPEQLNRWLPLIGLLGLVLSAVLRIAGLIGPADVVDSVANTLHLPAHSSISPVEIAAAVAAVWGIGRKLYSTFVDVLASKGGAGRWAPLAASAVLIASAVLRLVGRGHVADTIDSFAGIAPAYAPVTPVEVGAAVAAAYGLVRGFLAAYVKTRQGR